MALPRIRAGLHAAGGNDRARTSASYRNGALEAIVPKAAQRAEPRQIPVSVVNAKNANTALTTSPGSA